MKKIYQASVVPVGKVITPYEYAWIDKTEVERGMPWDGNVEGYVGRMDINWNGITVDADGGIAIENMPDGAVVLLKNGEPIEIYWAEDVEDDAENLAQLIREQEEWDDKTNQMFCRMAGIEDEYELAGADTFESVMTKAAEILGVEI